MLISRNDLDCLQIFALTKNSLIIITNYHFDWGIKQNVNKLLNDIKILLNLC
jgi:hypothetical protein